MPSFRQRPLCWLFVIATACVNLAALVTNHETAWFDAVAAGQTLAAGGWLALGSNHRLARAATVVAVIELSVLPDYLSRGDDSLTWRYVLGTLIFLAAACALAAFSWSAAARAASRGRPIIPRGGLQFPLVEIFGWMIVVAIAVVGCREAEFVHTSGERIIVNTTLAVAAAGVMSLLILDWGAALVPRLAVTASIALAIVVSHRAGSSPLGACAYVAVWCLAWRLDALRSADGPSHPRLHDEPAAPPSRI